MDLHEQQLKREAQEACDGIDRYYQQAEAQGTESTAVGSRYIRSLILPLTTAFDEWRDRLSIGHSSISTEVLPMIQHCSSQELAYLTLRTAIASANKSGYQYASTCVALGMRVEEHSGWKNALADKDVAGYFRVVGRSLSTSTSERHRSAVARHVLQGKGSVAVWDRRIRTLVGLHLMERCITATGHFTKVSVGHGVRSRTFLHMAPEIVPLLEAAHDRASLLTPMHGPMVVPPLDWTIENTGGGYLTSDAPLVKYGLNVHDCGLPPHSQPVIDAVNQLQAVKWQVNPAVLAHLTDAWESNSQTAGLPSQEAEPLPAKPLDIATNDDARQAWKRSAAAVHAANGKVVSQRVGVMSTLEKAKDMATFAHFHFVYQLDWRGRAYPIGAYLQPQGDDMARALLRFAEGKPLGEAGAFWLAVHTANMFGEDKCGLEARCNWVVTNTDAIMESALNPLNGTRWWTTADKPWSFLAACTEWLGFIMEGKDYVSHLPVHVDGSCNGLQHFAALMRDEVGASAVNLVPADEPSDIYTQVAEAVTKSIWKMPVEEDGNDPSHAHVVQWPEGIPRKLVKQSVMTVPYGVTRTGMTAQFNEKLKADDIGGDNRFAMASVLSTHTAAAVDLVISAPRVTMEWLQECATIAAGLERSLSWTTPTGFVVNQDYRVMGGERLAVYIGGQRVRTQVRYTTMQLDGRKQKNGIAPNFIHSLDASHLMSTVLLASDQGLTSIGAVHDSYATLAADMDVLALCLRTAFVEMYSDDLLDDLAHQFREQGLDVPDPPLLGEFDVSQVMKSDYFFA